MSSGLPQEQQSQCDKDEVNHETKKRGSCGCGHGVVYSTTEVEWDVGCRLRWGDHTAGGRGGNDVAVDAAQRTLGGR